MFHHSAVTNVAALVSALVVSTWILATGAWRDVGFWDDSAVWKDS